MNFLPSKDRVLTIALITPFGMIPVLIHACSHLAIERAEVGVVPACAHQ